MTKRILIVAADRGLGLGLAREFHARGWSVTGTVRPGSDAADLRAAGAADLARLLVEEVDIADAASVDGLAARLASGTFDVLFQNAGIWGPMHQSVLEATPEEVERLFMTNAVAPARIVRRLLGTLPAGGSLIAFMSSHRGSNAMNVEGGIELYRASKAALNSLGRSLWAEVQGDGRTMLTVHPGWVNTDMGTLSGTVSHEIELDESSRGVADLVERHGADRRHLYLDWKGRELPW